MDLFKEYLEAVNTTEQLNMYMSNIASVCDISCDIMVNMHITPAQKASDERINLKRTKLAYINITIQSLNVTDEDCSPYEYISLAYQCADSSELEGLLKQVKADVSGLIYCPLKCRLFKTNSSTAMEKFWNDELLKINTIKMKPLEPCCVCMCDTFAKTDCGHFLCVPCADKIISMDGDPPSCPICRTGNVHMRG